MNNFVVLLVANVMETDMPVESAQSMPQWITLVLEYIWIPVLVPVLYLVCRKMCQHFMYVKEIKRKNDTDIADFSALYAERIRKELQIEVESIIQYVGRSAQNTIDHHLYICKKVGKTVGFIKFMISKQHKYLFIAYVAIDNTDKEANRRALSLMVKGLAKKFFKPKYVNCVVTEVAATKSGAKSPMNLLVSRYAKSVGKKCYFIDFPYIQPKMPGENGDTIEDEFLNLLYIPFYQKENNCISKSELLKIIESIYYEIYAPCCDVATGDDCEKYNQYLSSIIDMYRTDAPDQVKLVPLNM